MKNKKDVCVIVQARLGSQRVPRKMLRPLAGTTLLEIIFNKISQCKSFSKEDFFLSAWEEEIKVVAKKHKINVFNRSERSANSEGTPMTEMYEWWNKLPYEYCILINACAPFLKFQTIDRFCESYCSSDSDGMFGVMGKKNYFWNSSGNLITPLTEDVMNTKTVETTYEAAHCLYAGRLDRIGGNVWMGDFNRPGDIELFDMEEEECFDIDYEWQFTMAEKMLGAK